MRLLGMGVTERVRETERQRERILFIRVIYNHRCTGTGKVVLIVVNENIENIGNIEMLPLSWILLSYSFFTIADTNRSFRLGFLL